MAQAEKLWKERALFGLAASLALLWLAGCSNAPQNDQQIKQQAAQTTQQVKSGAQQAAADAKAAAANAERKVDDITSGVKEGLNSGASSNMPGSIDINSASEARLITLPGISLARARRIVNNRPYAAPYDLVSKGVLTRAEYKRISGQIVARSDTP